MRVCNEAVKLEMVNLTLYYADAIVVLIIISL